MMMWQPIETAPRNQTFLAVLNCAGEQTICTMRWPVAEAKNSRPDSKTFHVERVTHWMPLPDLPGAQALPAENAVAYLDLGTGGYMDVGTDLTDEELAALPKGRHMLGIIGTYGVDGYVPAQPAPSLASVDVSLISEGKTQPAQSVPDDILRDAVRYRFLRAAKNIPISSKAARDPVVYDAAIDAAMLAAAPEAKP